MLKHSVLHLGGGCRGFRVPFTGAQRRETATVTLLVESLENRSLLYISFSQKMTAEISAVLWQIESPAGSLWVQAEKVISDHKIANCSGSAALSWTAVGLMCKTRACTWRYFCFYSLCPGEGDLSVCHHPAKCPQEHLDGPWNPGCRFSWSLVIPWPCQMEILE